MSDRRVPIRWNSLQTYAKCQCGEEYASSNESMVDRWIKEHFYMNHELEDFHQTAVVYDDYRQDRENDEDEK